MPKYNYKVHNAEDGSYHLFEDGDWDIVGFTKNQARAATWMLNHINQGHRIIAVPDARTENLTEFKGATEGI